MAKKKPSQPKVPKEALESLEIDRPTYMAAWRLFREAHSKKSPAEFLKKLKRDVEKRLKEHQEGEA